MCSKDGRHLAMMPHPERCVLSWQWPWKPPTWLNKQSPWLRMFQNAFVWCQETNWDIALRWGAWQKQNFQPNLQKLWLGDFCAHFWSFCCQSWFLLLSCLKILLPSSLFVNHSAYRHRFWFYLIKHRATVLLQTLAKNRFAGNSCCDAIMLPSLNKRLDHSCASMFTAVISGLSCSTVQIQSWILNSVQVQP